MSSEDFREIVNRSISKIEHGDGDFVYHIHSKRLKIRLYKDYFSTHGWMSTMRKYAEIMKRNEQEKTLQFN